MKTVGYKDMKTILKNMNNKRLLVKLSGAINEKLYIEKSKVYLKNNKIFIIDNGIERISIDIRWICNYYTNETSNALKYIFDDFGECLIHII